MQLLRPPFRYIHLAWALAWLAACVMMALTPGGHPPLLAFVPFVLAGAILAHALLLVVAWLADRGRRRAGIVFGAPSGWPLEAGVLGLVLCTVAVGAAAITTSELGMLRQRPLEWSLLALIAAAHLAAFLALMLRHGSARWLAALVAAGWATALALQLHEARGPGELAFGFAVIAALGGIAAWALRSARLRRFLH